MPPNPLVLTLLIDRQLSEFLTSLRTRYFPGRRNHLDAHITLFHALPGRHRNAVEQSILQSCKDHGPFALAIGHPTKMGHKGVMVKVTHASRLISTIHHDIQTHLLEALRNSDEGLTDQDRRPVGGAHVTVMNKAKDEEDVDRCLREMIELFDELGPSREKTGTALGFQL